MHTLVGCTPHINVIPLQLGAVLTHLLIPLLAQDRLFTLYMYY